MLNWFIYSLKKLPTDAIELDKLANELGVSLSGTFMSESARTGMNIYEAQHRIREAISHRLASWLWLLAVVSAIASFFSAVAAWKAVLSN